MDDLLTRVQKAKSLHQFFEGQLLHKELIELTPEEVEAYESVVDLCLDIIDPPGKSYMFRFYLDDVVDVIIECATSLKDAVIQLADKYRFNTNLFKTALSACDETNCVDMFNQFVTSGRYIVDQVYRIDKLVYINHELIQGDDDD